MSKNKIINYAICLSAIIIVAGLGALFANLGMDWFDALTKPTQWISNFVIPVMWSIIYLSFAVILFIWIKNKTLPKNIIVLLIINGILNILWCLTFFTLKQLLIGNIIIVINALFAIKLIFEISKESKIYGYILSIYPIWVCIATTLNTALWILN